MKKDLGNLLALYPTPVTIVGALVDGKPNWMEVAHVGIIGHDRVTISCVTSHYTNKGIHAAGLCTLNLVNQDLLQKADYVGTVSGKDTDKSQVFAWSKGQAGAPVIDASPLVLEWQVDDVYNTPNFETFILKILHTYVEEDMLNENGKPDYAKISPVLFEFPNYQYLSTGKVVGHCRKMNQ